MTQKQITDIKIGSNSAIKAMLNNEIVWPYEINTEDYMTIEILEDDSYINLGTNINTDEYITYSSVLDGYSYCINSDGVWISNFYQQPLEEYNLTNNTPKLKAGDKVSFKKTMSSGTKENAPKFSVRKIENNKVVEATFNLSGNCMSVIYGHDAKNHYSLLEYPAVFYGMFEGSKVINVSPNFLPATTLAKSCYKRMFEDCTSLVNAPTLPATTLAEGCYYAMFAYCYSLTKAPELPATTSATYCYLRMFDSCTSLTTPPKLPATTLRFMCYSNMFDGCTSLTEAPELPATTLVNSCYSYMFKGCKSLTEAPELPATTLKSHCYSGMFEDCTSLTTPPELPATTLDYGCYSGMFEDCTSLTEAPKLPATTLKYYCYNRMFLGCSALSSITALFDSFGDTSLYATTDWVSGVSLQGTFTMNSNANWNPEDHRGSSGVPEDWTVVYY